MPTHSIAPMALLVLSLAAPAADAAPVNARQARRTAAAPKRAPLTEAQALTTLSNAIEKDRVYAPMAIACMSFVVEERAPDAFGIAVREKHGGRCGGDPKTAPILDRVKVDRASGALAVYDVLEQEYYTWAEFTMHRSGQGQ